MNGRIDLSIEGVSIKLEDALQLMKLLDVELEKVEQTPFKLHDASNVDDCKKQIKEISNSVQGHLPVMNALCNTAIHLLNEQQQALNELEV